MTPSVTTAFRSRAESRAKPLPPQGHSIWFWLAVITASAVIAVVVTDLVDPGRRAGATPGGLVDFLSAFGLFTLLLGIGVALLSTISDIMNAWERSTPESERRRDGGILDGFGSDDGDGDGGDCGGD